MKIEENGFFLRGVVVSSTAKVIQKKDGSGPLVIVSHEIGTQPGLICWEAFHDPVKRTDVRVVDGQAVEFPRLEPMKPITLKVNRYRCLDKELVLQDCEPVAQ